MSFSQILVPNAVSWFAMWLASLLLAWGLYRKECVRDALLQVCEGTCMPLGAAEAVYWVPSHFPANLSCELAHCPASTSLHYVQLACCPASWCRVALCGQCTSKLQRVCGSKMWRRCRERQAPALGALLDYPQAHGTSAAALLVVFCPGNRQAHNTA